MGMLGRAAIERQGGCDDYQLRIGATVPAALGHQLHPDRAATPGAMSLGLLMPHT
jgi:hypothetical protein